MSSKQLENDDDPRPPHARRRCMGCMGHVPAVTGPVVCDIDGCPLPATTISGRRTLCGWSDSPDAAWPDEVAWQRVALQRAVSELRRLVDALGPVAEGSDVFERAKIVLLFLEDQSKDDSHKDGAT